MHPLADLLARYSQANRFQTKKMARETVDRYILNGHPYHNMNHITHALTFAARLVCAEHNLSLVQLAIWYHDVIYDPTQNDNEARSATFCRKHLEQLNCSIELIERVTELIMTTRNHQPKSVDAELLVDADLAILGMERPKYIAYAKGIREEYAHVDDQTYVDGRKAVLRRFLEQERIYSTPRAVKQLESNARVNIEWEIGALHA